MTETATAACQFDPASSHIGYADLYHKVEADIIKEKERALGNEEVLNCLSVVDFD